IEQPVGRTDESRERGLAKPQILEKSGLLVGSQSRDFRLDAGREHQTGGTERFESRGEVRGHRFSGPRLAAIERDEERLVTQESVSPERASIELHRGEGPQRSTILEDALHLLECSYLVCGRLLLASTV